MMNYEKKDRKSILISILVILFISTFVMLRQLISKDYFSCHGQDTFAYVSWAWQFKEALKEGIIYPRWLPVNFWDYGAPTFILQPPFAFYLVAFFNIFTESVIKAMNITKFVALFISGAGIFFLVREYYSEKTALLTSSFYIIFPYNIFQFYCVGTFASTISFMWFSPIILFTYRYIKDKQYMDIVYAGFCYGGLILTHLINAYMFTFILVAFIIYMSIVKRRLKGLAAIYMIGLIGLLISSAYIMPIIFEKQFINLKEFIGEGAGNKFLFDYRNFFILPNMTSKFPPGHLWNAFYDTFVFYVMILCIIIILSLLRISKLKNIETNLDSLYMNKFFICSAFLTIFLLFGISTFVWEIIPFFKYIQFAHRWLNITTFTVILSSSCIFLFYENIYRKKKGYVFFIVMLFLICFLLDFRFIESASAIHGHELLPVKAANWYREHLPIWVDIEKVDKSEDIKKAVAIQKAEASVEVVAWKSAERVIEIKALKPVTLRIRTFYFPGWKAYIDDMQVAIKTERGEGAILIDIPRGNHKLVLRFEDTPVRFYSKIITIISFSGIFLGVLIFKRRKYQ